MYEVKLQQTQCPYYAKARLNGTRKHRDVVQPDSALHEHQSFVCCQISEGIPSKSQKYETDKWKPPKYHSRMKPKKEEVMEKIDIYYFDHGNSS